jgi:hypothetical protein
MRQPVLRRDDGNERKSARVILPELIFIDRDVYFAISFSYATSHGFAERFGEDQTPAGLPRSEFRVPSKPTLTWFIAMNRSATARRTDTAHSDIDGLANGNLPQGIYQLESARRRRL